MGEIGNGDALVTELVRLVTDMEAKRARIRDRLTSMILMDQLKAAGEIRGLDEGIGRLREILGRTEAFMRPIDEE